MDGWLGMAALPSWDPTGLPIGLLGQGFLPFRGSLMLDVVFLAMFAIVPVLWLSVALAKAGRYNWHRRIQLTMAAVLAVAVILFEIDMRLFTDWRTLAADSAWAAWCPALLYVHLLFAIPTPLLWIWIIIGAWPRFQSESPAGFADPDYRVRHRRLGWWGAGMMLGTAVTGIVFYIVAFIL